MATTLYFRNTAPDWSRGEGDTNLQGTTVSWFPFQLSTVRGSAQTNVGSSTITGPVTGIEIGNSVCEWISGPLDQDITISGSITANLWGNESSMNANAGLGIIVERLNSQGARISTIMQNDEVGIELGTSNAVRTESTAATSTNMLKGERFRVRPYLNDAVTTTMASGYVAYLSLDGPTAAADGDSYITFTEDFGFLTSLGTAVVTQDVSDSNIQLYGGTGTQEKLAQGFNLASDADISVADLHLGKNNSPTDNLVLDIVSTLDGSSLGSVTMAASSIAVAASLVRFTFSSPVSLTAGNYFLQLSRSGARDITNYIAWSYKSGTNPYAGGQLHFRNSGSWDSSFTTSDLRFILYEPPPTGSTLYLTNTAAAVDPNGASYDAKEAWTSRGAGVTSGTRSDVAGPTAPLLATASAGGNFVEWFTKSLTAFTLDGLVACNIRALEVNAASNAAVRCEIALTAADGTSPVIWGAANDGVELGTSEAAMTFNVAGDSTAVTDGQRLRIRVYFDDAPGVAMGASSDMTLYWAGTSAAASGDTYITLPQTVTEYSAGAAANQLVTVGGRGITQALYPTASG